MFDKILSPFAEFANQTLEWFGEDNQENFKQHKLDMRLVESGWLNKTIEYKFNSLGYRTDEIDYTVPCICVFGCSVTMGSAMRSQDLYLSHIGNHLKLQTYNFGIGGGSDSTSVRLALTWLAKLNVKLVIYQQSFPERVEVICNDVYPRIHGVNAMLGGDTFKDSGEFMRHWAINDVNGELLAIKNKLAIERLCDNLGIKLITLHINEFFQHTTDWARDLKHPGATAHKLIAEKVLNTL